MQIPSYTKADDALKPPGCRSCCLQERCTHTHVNDSHTVWLRAVFKFSAAPIDILVTDFVYIAGFANNFLTIVFNHIIVKTKLVYTYPCITVQIYLNKAQSGELPR